MYKTILTVILHNVFGRLTWYENIKLLTETMSARLFKRLIRYGMGLFLNRDAQLGVIITHAMQVAGMRLQSVRREIKA